MKNLEELFSILYDGVPEEDEVEDVPPTPAEVEQARRLLFPLPGVPENALLFIAPCFCFPAEVQADGGSVPHAFRHHVRFITFED